MIVIGVTGSIGMGKSTAGAMLEYLGVPVHDADATVHDLLSTKSKARIAIGAAFPYFRYYAIYGRKNKNGVREINRQKLGALVFKNPKEREKLENILHPLVRESQNDFIHKQHILGRNMVALDIPLLFETAADSRVDYTITASAPTHIQTARVLARPDMTRQKFDAIRKTQMHDIEKTARADYVLPTGLGRAHTMKSLKKIIHDIQARQRPDDKQIAI
ncbi:MAG: dephospho-CoA kinase [Bdellovibrionales bacterium]